MQKPPQAMAEPKLPDLPSFDAGARARSSANDFPRLALPADFDATGLALECARHVPYPPTSGVRYRTLPPGPSASEPGGGSRRIRSPSGRTCPVTSIRRLGFTHLRSTVWRVQLRACLDVAASNKKVLDRAVLRAKPHSDTRADDHPASKSLLGKS
jgi:hypothetical protein